jgi:hypothetical protein
MLFSSKLQLFLVTRWNCPFQTRTIRRMNSGLLALVPPQVAECLWSPILKEAQGYESLVPEKRLRVKDANMNPKKTDPPPDLRPEYDFSAAKRGQHHLAYTQETKVVILDSDVAEIFKDSASVNEALRLLLRLAKEQSQITRSAS